MTNGASTERVRPAIPVASAFAGAAARKQPGPLPVRTAYGQHAAVSWMPRLRRVANALVAPLHQRVRRGEGGLFLVNAALALQWHPVGEGLGLAAISLGCLLALYLFNDVVDARDDQHNPKKNRFLAAMYSRNRSTFFGVWVLLTGLVIAPAAWLDARAAAAVLAVTLVNVTYSLLCKKVPLLDVVWVGLWGGVYASIVTSSPAWILMVAAMTAVCQIYQTCEDRGADARNGVATSATLAAPVLSLLQAGLAGVLVVTAWSVESGTAAVAFAGLFAYWLAWRDQPRTPWILAKAHFSVVCAYLLLRGSGG